MKTTKIQIAFAEDIDEHRKRIITAINHTKKYELSIRAVSGRDLILKLKRAKKLPAIVLMDMQMPCCDGLLATTICKALFPNIKIVGLSSHTDGIVVGEFLAEGGDCFLSKYIIANSVLSKSLYKDDAIFEKALLSILNNKTFVDILLEDNGNAFKNRLSTQELILKNCKDLQHHEVLYMLLNAAGFNREKIALLMHKTESSIQKYGDKLRKHFNAENHNDLVAVAITLGIAKFVHIYQPANENIFT